MKRSITIAVAGLAAFLAMSGCEEAKKPSYVEAQYDVEYLSMTDTRVWVGDLSQNLGEGDYYGYCSATTSSGVKTISVLVADSIGWPNPDWMIKFHRLEWPVDSPASVTCDHVEIFDEQTGSDNIPCAGDDSCQITISRNEDLKNTVQLWFTCSEFDTNVSTGGVPNRMAIANGAMQIQHCRGF